MAVEKMFTVCGITTHARCGVEVTKVRWGTDTVRLVKMLSSNRKIGVSYDLGGRGDGFLDSVRVELADLPQPMSKLDALKHIAGLPQFQSAADQFIIQSEIADRSKAAKRGEVKFAGAVVTKVAKEAAKA